MLASKRFHNRRVRRALWLAASIGVVATFAGYYAQEGGREHAIATAKKYGQVQTYMGNVQLVLLSNRKGVSEVLPVLKDVPDLVGLSIYGVSLTDDDIRRICDLKQLEDLRLDKCDVDDADLQRLSVLTGVAYLVLHRNPVTDDGLHALSSMTNLKRLDLSTLRIDGTGLQKLTADLKELWLSATLVNDDTIGICGRFSHLWHLEFLDTHVTEKGLMKLVDLHWATNVGPPNEVPRDARNRFKAANRESTEAARAAGGDVPPIPTRAAGRPQ